jgi:cell division septation protein DedD
MIGTGTPRKQPGQFYAQPVLVVALLALLPVAGCKHAPAPTSRPSEKDEHSQQPAAAPAPVEAPAPAQSGLEGPRFAVQVAAFNRRANAEALAFRLSEEYGLQTLVAPVEARGKTLYRVRLLIQNKNQAKSLASVFLRTEKLKVWVVPLP